MIVHGGGTIRLCAPSDVRLLKRGNVAEVSQSYSLFTGALSGVLVSIPNSFILEFHYTCQMIG